ncbi:MAG: prenyltransferase/squalene oxidase repeat-containing protein [Victivallales bacterium]|nr:prenyltransferase/squalene oxidase repeat-containing protein [Victivallales bacterium]
MKKRRFPIEIVIALAVNLLIILLLLQVTFDSPPPPPVNVEVDISNFKLPKPEIIPPLKQQPVENSGEKKVSPAQARADRAAQDKALIDAAMNDVVPQDISEAINTGQTVSQRNEEVNNIVRDLKLWNDLKSFRSGSGNSSLPPGLQTGASFKSRGDPASRQRLLRRYGGSAKSEDAVEKALKYLAERQNPDGSWGGEQSLKTGDMAALSALSLLSFLAHGENFNSKEYGKTVTKGADFLCRLADMPDIESAGKGFGHAILTYALAEAYALSGSLTLRRKLESRLHAIIGRQNKFGSFSLNYDNSPCPAPPSEEEAAKVQTMVGEPRCDLSLLGWHIQALTAAKNAGVKVEGLDKALQMALETLVKIHQAAKGGFSQGINMKRFPFDVNLNAVGLLGMQLLNAGRSSPARRAERILDCGGHLPLPRWKSGWHFPLYRWYYQTQALFQAEGGRGNIWTKWNTNLKAELIKYQQPDGSWSVPGGDKSFQLKDADDLKVYSTGLCALMLEVYYRYLPSYSIAESANFRDNRADELDLGKVGLITQLPGGADPMANIILGMGPTTMEPVYFGVFNGIPASSRAKSATDEFKNYSSFSSTIPVRKPEEWPQLLQPNQRLTLFLDDLIPENFKGHLLLQLALTGTPETAFASEMSLEAVINGKRLFNSKLPRDKDLVELLIPSGRLQAFGNILEIRNNGSASLAFDAARLSAVSKVGKPLYLGAENFETIPEYIRDLFTVGVITVTGKTTPKEIATHINQIRTANAEAGLKIQKMSPENFTKLVGCFADKAAFWELENAKQAELLRKVNPKARIIMQRGASEKDTASFELSPYEDNCQALPSLAGLGKYSPDGEYWGCRAAHGTETLGDNFQRHYLRQAGRQIIDWIASGGSAVVLSRILDGGEFFDPVFKTELPALCALRQAAKLFEGRPRKLPAGIYPKYGEKPLFAANVAAAYNAPGVATVIVAKRFPIPEETEIQVLVPWNGATEVDLESGFLPKGNPFAGIGTPLTATQKTVEIVDNTFTYSGVFSEMTVFRLVRKGSNGRLKPLKEVHYEPPKVEFDLHAARVERPELETKLHHLAYRDANAFITSFGSNAGFQRIPATYEKGQFKPAESQSVEVTFSLKADNRRHDSVYLQLGKGDAQAEFMSFTVFARVTSKRKSSTYPSIPLCFELAGKCFRTYVPVNKWRRVIIQFDKNFPVPDWQSLRMLEPGYIADRKITAVAYELNDIAAYTKTPVAKLEKTNRNPAATAKKTAAKPKKTKAKTGKKK